MVVFYLWSQRFESQFVLHLQYIVFRSSSRAGGKLDLIGTRMLCSIDHSQSFASILSASPINPFVNPLCVWFCILWINGCILSLITASTIMLITGRNCYSSIVDGVVFASDRRSIQNINRRKAKWTSCTSRCKSCIRQSYTFTSVPAYVPRGNSGQNVDYY
jgi:hypothetical protein